MHLALDKLMIKTDPLGYDSDTLLIYLWTLRGIYGSVLRITNFIELKLYISFSGNHLRIAFCPFAQLIQHPEAIYEVPCLEQQSGILQVSIERDRTVANRRRQQIPLQSGHQRHRRTPRLHRQIDQSATITSQKSRTRMRSPSFVIKPHRSGLRPEFVFTFESKFDRLGSNPRPLNTKTGELLRLLQIVQSKLGRIYILRENLERDTEDRHGLYLERLLKFNWGLTEMCKSYADTIVHDERIV